jgi:hypothetical protein
MPTIATPGGFETHNPSRNPSPRHDSPAAGIQLRIKVRGRRGALTRQLADGADPASSPELSLRATQLISDRRRRQMARSLRRTITDARQPAITRAAISIVNRHAVLEADDALQATIARLASPDPVAAKGMAMLERVMSDGISSPMYNVVEPGTLRRHLLVAKAELDLHGTPDSARPEPLSSTSSAPLTAF